MQSYFKMRMLMAKTCPAPRFTFSMRDTLRSIKELTKSLASRKTSSIGRSGEFKGAWSDVGFTIYLVRFLRTFARPAVRCLRRNSATLYRLPHIELLHH
jgi:hypothetical protein